MSRKPFPHTRHMGVSAARLWDVISTPGFLASCHPLVESNTAEVWPGPDARDTVVYYSGYVLHRHFTDWMEGVGYDIDILDPKDKMSCGVSWRIREHGPTESSLTITLKPRRFTNGDGIAGLMTWVPYHMVMRFNAIWYLSLVLKGIDQYATTGRIVRRNQFGPYPVFSPPNCFPWKKARNDSST